METITRAHDGGIRVANRPEGGAVVEIELPIVADREKPEERPDTSTVRADDGAATVP